MSGADLPSPVTAPLCAVCLVLTVLFALGTTAPGCRQNPPPTTEGEVAAEGEHLPAEGEAHVEEGEAAPEGELAAEGEVVPNEGEPAPVLPDGDCTYEVVHSYPHDANAFTQGLVWDEGRLYEGTGLYGQSELRRVELETGAVLDSVTLSRHYFGEGITILDERVLQLTWRHGVGFVYDKSTLTAYDQFAYNTEGWGLTHDGQHLIMSDGTATLYFLDPDSYQVLSSVSVHQNGAPVVRLNELEYVEGEVLANVWQTDRIVRINPETGAVIAWIYLDGLAAQAGVSGRDAVLNGIACDAASGRLFVTGKLWPRLFEIRLVPMVK